jgi:TRAP transporter TAXI family solute receptor
MDADVPVFVVSSVLVVDASMSDDLAWEITRALFDHRDELVAVHREARNLSLETASRGSPIPFHPGAIRYYREQNVWID